MGQRILIRGPGADEGERRRWKWEGEKLMQAGSWGGGGGGGGRVQRKANPPGTRKAEEVLTVPERGLSTQPLAQGLREGGTGLTAPSSPFPPFGVCWGWGTP